MWTVTFTTYDNERIVLKTLRQDQAETLAKAARNDGHMSVRVWSPDDDAEELTDLEEPDPKLYTLH